MSIDLIFECLSEEILIDEQLNAVDQLTKNIKGLLKKQQIQHNEIIGFCTPRRLVLIVHKIITNNSEESYIKGPSTDASSISIIGFAKKHNTTPEALLTFSIRDKKFYGIARKSLAITHTITNILTNTLQTIKWQKNMHWGTHELKWARPIHNIMYVLSNEKAKLTLGHIESNNTTYTGRFIKNSEKKEINSIDEYIKCMLDNNIILDQNERVRIFRDKIKEIAAEYHMKISQDLKDASAVALATEMPHAMLVEINQTLVASLPEEIIVSVLETYSFLPMWQEDGSLSSKTITAINIPPTTIIVDGYRKMLESRLMDAMHIWQQSIIQDPKLLYNRLQRISFYESLGDMAEKTTRITALAKYLAIWIPHAQIDQVEKAANIAKLDLTMSITKEFPKLQGIIGGIYAANKGFDQEISQAIAEHYLPYGMHSDMPKTPAGIAISIADKLDTLTGFFVINKQPTGSQDPFALRRAALSIIRILLNNELDMPIEIAVHKATQLYPHEVRKTKLSTKLIQKINIIKHAAQKHNIDKEESNIDDKIVNFIMEKFISILLTEKKFDIQTILAITSTSQRHSCIIITKKIKELSIFIQSTTGQTVINCYKRIYNILEKNNDKEINVNPELLQTTEENVLFQQIKNTEEIIDKTIKNTLQQSIKALCELLNYINTFLDNTTIMTNNHELCQNRLALLQNVKTIFHKVANFQCFLQTNNNTIK